MTNKIFSPKSLTTCLTGFTCLLLATGTSAGPLVFAANTPSYSPETAPTRSLSSAAPPAPMSQTTTTTTTTTSTTEKHETSKTNKTSHHKKYHHHGSYHEESYYHGNYNRTAATVNLHWYQRRWISSTWLNGFYVGGQIGWGSIHQPMLVNLQYVGIDSAVTGRVYVGYQFIKYLALEIGYTRFGNMNVFNDPPLAPFVVNGTAQAYAGDIVFKGIIPLTDRFDIYGKLGVAFLHEYETLALTLPGFDGSLNGSNSEHKWLPTFSLGMSYDFTPHISGDISWMHIQAVGQTLMQNTDFGAIGVAYRIG